MIEKIAMSMVPAAGSAGRGAVGAIGTAAGATGADFAAFVKGFAEKSMNATATGETQSLKAVDKDAELVDVVTAVSNAEVTLDTVVTLRDRVIQAYQEIIRMPV